MARKRTQLKRVDSQKVKIVMFKEQLLCSLSVEVMFLMGRSFILEIANKSTDSTLGMKLCKYGNGVANFWTAYGAKCCGSLGVYDENRAKCCNGQKIVQKDLFCGKRKYDQCTETCCGGIIHRKVEGATCCGPKTYNTKTQICCNNIPVAKFKCKKVWYRRRSHLRRAQAVCSSYYGIYYSPEHNKRCPGKFDNVKFIVLFICFAFYH